MQRVVMFITIPARKTDMFAWVVSELSSSRTEFNATFNVEEKQWEIELI